jgi:hypothetical protein
MHVKELMCFQSSTGKGVLRMSSCLFFRHIIRVEWVFYMTGVVVFQVAFDSCESHVTVYLFLKSITVRYQ